MAQEFHIEFAPRTAVHVEEAEPLGAVQVLVERVVGNPTQEQINIAVAEYIEEHPGAISGLTDDIKQALLACIEHVGWKETDGREYYDALYEALYERMLVGISATYTQSGTVYNTASLDSLKSDLVVVANYNDSTTETLAPTDYTLSGTLEVGTSTVTVSYQGFTASFNVTVTSDPVPSAYKRIEYVERPTSTGASYGYNSTYFKLNGTDTAVFELGCMIIQTPSSNSGAYFVGCRQNDSSNSVGFGVFVNKAMTTIGAWDGTECSISPNGGSSIKNTKFDLVVTKTTSGLTVTDGTNTNSITSTPRAMSTNLYLFGVLQYNKNELFCPLWGRIYYLKITEGGVDKVDLIPCKRISDNAVGFYDIVADTFRTSSSYTAGPEV